LSANAWLQQEASLQRICAPKFELRSLPSDRGKKAANP
jgi:hypothetical protein